jgi:alanine racemase
MSYSMDEIAERGHPVWAEIDLGALRHNVRTLRAAAGGAEVMAVVKGYAYGHGNPECARAMLAAGATRLGVARVAEAIHLRKAGVAAPIHVLTEPPPQAIPAMLAHELTPTLYSQNFARALSDAAARPVACHVKLDTGMHRVGVPAPEVPEVMAVLRSLDGIVVEGAWSHLAVADVPDHPFTRKQLDLFSELTEAIERAGTRLRYRHIANSAATLSEPGSRFDIVRCGIACYGLWPGPAFEGTADLRPVLALKARVNLVKELPAGESLSYGLNYELARKAKIATVPMGYADGYDRRLSSRADVLLGGHRYRVSGTVCMDQFLVDVGSSEVEAGDVVTVIGADGEERVSAEELARHIGTINYEVTARIPSRVPRLYLDEAELE